MGYEAGPGVDRMEDIHRLKIKSDSIGTVLIFDTLWHVEDVYQAMREMCGGLKSGGIESSELFFLDSLQIICIRKGILDVGVKKIK